jgi:hypothetical protein
MAAAEVRQASKAAALATFAAAGFAAASLAPIKHGQAVAMVRWSVDIIRGKKVEHLGTFEAPDQRAAYKAAVEKFDVPIERQNCLFVTKLGEREG